MRWKTEDTPERKAFREGFREWLSTKVPKGWMEAIDSSDDEAFKKASESFNFMSWARVIGSSGYAAPLWPKEFGGLSGEVWTQQIVREELARYRLPLFGLNLLGVGLVGPTLIEHGSEEQKSRYLAKILTGEEIWCQLFSEPGSGSDLASLATRAVRDGDEWVINGQKVWTSIAQFSKFGMLLARTDPELEKHEGLTYFVLDMSSPGVEIRPLVQLTGSAEFNEVYLTDVRVPDENRVGPVGDGWRAARTTLMNERVTLSGISLDAASITGGARKDPFESMIAGISDRQDGLVRQRVAQLFAEQEAKEITAFRASMARLAGQQPGPEGGVNKVFNAELNQRRSNFLMDAAGLSSIAWDPNDRTGQARAHTFLRARANTIEGGTSEVLKNQMAERILGLPRDVDPGQGLAWKDTKRN